MSLKDKLKGMVKKAENSAADHKDQVEKAIDKAEQLADQRTQDKYHNQIAKAGTKAGAYVEGLQPSDPPEPTSPPSQTTPKQN